MEGRESGARAGFGRLPCRSDGAGDFPFGRAPSAGQTREGTGKKKRKGRRQEGRRLTSGGQVAAGERTARAVMKAEQR